MRKCLCVQCLYKQFRRQQVNNQGKKHTCPVLVSSAPVSSQKSRVRQQNHLLKDYQHPNQNHLLKDYQHPKQYLKTKLYLPTILGTKERGVRCRDMDKDAVIFLFDSTSNCSCVASVNSCSLPRQQGSQEVQAGLRSETEDEAAVGAGAERSHWCW